MIPHDSQPSTSTRPQRTGPRPTPAQYPRVSTNRCIAGEWCRACGPPAPAKTRDSRRSWVITPTRPARVSGGRSRSRHAASWREDTLRTQLRIGSAVSRRAFSDAVRCSHSTDCRRRYSSRQIGGNRHHGFRNPLNVYVQVLLDGPGLDVCSQLGRHQQNEQINPQVMFWRSDKVDRRTGRIRQGFLVATPLDGLVGPSTSRSTGSENRRAQRGIAFHVKRLGGPTNPARSAGQWRRRLPVRNGGYPPSDSVFGLRWFLQQKDAHESCCGPNVSRETRGTLPPNPKHQTLVHEHIQLLHNPQPVVMPEVQQRPRSPHQRRIPNHSSEGPRTQQPPGSISHLWAKESQTDAGRPGRS
ncbi:hypothetical protein QFZ79_001185 [Arthrobacter sp. V4I6]|nr:hypothetical protein [Arthrobacter sp. V1I7]MDQ0853074.1 hypothetical protein [Arthrobacter sp. V4I6]